MLLSFRRLLLICLSFALPMQQAAAAAMWGCDPGGSPHHKCAWTGQATLAAEAFAGAGPHHCHDASHTPHATASSHGHPASGSGHTQCAFCAGAGASQLIPPTLSLPAVHQYTLAQAGPLPPWRIQFLTSGPDRPPRTAPV